MNININATDQIAARQAIAELQGVITQRDPQKAHAAADEILMTFLNTHSDPMCKRVAAAWKRSAERCGFTTGLTRLQRQRIDNGVELLNHRHPTWATGIYLDVLDVESDELCVLGQLFGDFYRGMELLELTHEATVAYGFYPDETEIEDMEMYKREVAKAKNAYWREQIIRRRNVMKGEAP